MSIIAASWAAVRPGPMSELGSNSEVELADADFRFTPESRHPAVGLGCPFRAKKRLMRRSKSTSLFDHLVGAGQQRRWHDDAKRLCGLQIDHQVEFGRLFDRQVGRLRTLEYLVGKAG